MTLPRWIKRSLWAALAVILLLALVVGAAWLYFNPDVQRTNGVAYG